MYSGIIELASSRTVIADGNVLYSGNPNPSHWLFATFFLEITADATDGTDTLDVYIQDRLPVTSGGTLETWRDVVHFAQALGNAGATVAEPDIFQVVWSIDQLTSGTQFAQVRGEQKTSQGTGDADLAVGRLAASTVIHGPFRSDLRVSWTVTSGNDPSFTFKVYAIVRG